MNIHEALSALDPEMDDDWTKDGLPKTEAVSELVGETVTRAQITEAAPEFSRTNLVLEEADATPSTPADPGTDPEDASDDDEDQDDDGTSDDEDDEDEDEQVEHTLVAGVHPKIKEAADALDEANKALGKAQLDVRAAEKAHVAAIQKYSPMVRTPAENQQSIMDVIAHGHKVKEAKFKEAQAVNAAMKSVGNPIDRANQKPAHIGHGNLHSRTPAGES